MPLYHSGVQEKEIMSVLVVHTQMDLDDLINIGSNIDRAILSENCPFSCCEKS